MGESTGFKSSREVRWDRLIHEDCRQERIGSKIRTGALQMVGMEASAVLSCMWEYTGEKSSREIILGRKRLMYRWIKDGGVGGVGGVGCEEGEDCCNELQCESIKVKSHHGR